MHELILAALAGGPLSTAQIVNRVNAPLHEIELEFRVLLGQLRVQRVGVAQWGLLALPPDAALSNMASSMCGLVKGLSAQSQVG